MGGEHEDVHRCIQRVNVITVAEEQRAATPFVLHETRWKRIWLVGIFGTDDHQAIAPVQGRHRLEELHVSLLGYEPTDRAYKQLIGPDTELRTGAQAAFFWEPPAREASQVDSITK